MKNNKLLILIEDSDEDYYAIKRAFTDGDDYIPILRFGDGESSLDFLEDSKNLDETLQILIILDLNLPGNDGYSILKRIRQIEGIQFVPVVIFTSSISELDIANAYKNGANSFLKKNVQFEIFKKDIELIKGYWFGKNLYPKSVA
jgi:CheY-like chemotaxis protein